MPIVLLLRQPRAWISRAISSSENCNMAIGNSSRRFLSFQANSSTHNDGTPETATATATATTTARTTTEEAEHTNKNKHKKTPRPWDAYFQDLVTFQQEEGHTNVPHTYKLNPSLAYFVRRNRNHPEKLTPEQRKQLVELGFSWETKAERLERQWADKFQELLDYQKEYGDLHVPRGFEKNPPLGEWVNRQLSLQRKDDLPADRWQKLEDIGFPWRVGSGPVRNESTHDKKWHRQYQKLVGYYREHGDCLVPTKYDPDQSLGNWVAAQRGLYRKGLLKSDRMELLEGLHFVFDISFTDPAVSHLQRRWDEMFDLLQQYADQHGHFRVGRREGALGEWVAYQRTAEREGILDESRKQRLVELGFQFTKSRDSVWQENYEKLQRYREEHGHVTVPMKDDKELTQWMWTQRKSFREGKMTKDRQAKLDQLEFVWRVRNWSSSSKNDNAQHIGASHDKEETS